MTSTFKVLMKTKKIVHINKVFYYYYQNPDSATARFSDRDFDLLSVWDGVTQSCKEQGKYYSYAKLNRERLNYTLLMRMALAMPYDQILQKYGDEYKRLYGQLRESEKMLLKAPIPAGLRGGKPLSDREKDCGRSPEKEALTDFSAGITR